MARKKNAGIKHTLEKNEFQHRSDLMKYYRYCKGFDQIDHNIMWSACKDMPDVLCFGVIVQGGFSYDITHTCCRYL